MSLTNFEIKPNAGFGSLKFGTKIKPFVKQAGEPEEVENIDDDDEMNTTVLHYWDSGFSVFFVGLSDQILAGVETDHPDCTLYGKKIIGTSEVEIIKLLKDHGYTEYEAEFEDADKRLSFDIGMMDFYFREDKLIYMNFGVLVDEQGSIETI